VHLSSDEREQQQLETLKNAKKSAVLSLRDPSTKSADEKRFF